MPGLFSWASSQFNLNAIKANLSLREGTADGVIQAPRRKSWIFALGSQ
jgi:hypothetical protein